MEKSRVAASASDQALADGKLNQICGGLRRASATGPACGFLPFGTEMFKSLAISFMRLPSAMRRSTSS